MKIIRGDFGQAFLGDCRQVMSAFADGAFELGITDPPWGVEWSGYNGTPRREKGVFYSDNGLVEGWTDDFFRVTQMQVVFPGTQNIYEYPPCQEIGGYYNRSGNFGSKVAVFKHFCPALYYNIPYQTYMHSMIQCDSINNLKPFPLVHPCPRPRPVIEYFLKKREGLVTSAFDPFLGSGTLAECCEALGIRWCGTEINTDYVEDIKSSIREGKKQYRRSIEALSIDCFF